MKKKRNERRQYFAKDFKMPINFPSPFIILKYLLILFIISPWLFILMYKIDLKTYIQNIMENIFLVNKEDGKKTNGFF